MRRIRTDRAGYSSIVASVRRFMQRCASLLDGLTPKAIQHLRSRIRQKETYGGSGADTSQAVTDCESDSDSLNCTVAVEQDLGGETVFTVRIRGRICADQPGRRVNLNVKFDDITDDASRMAAVYVKPVDDCLSEPKPFEFVYDLGRLNEIETEMPNWLSVARIGTSMMAFARRGTRRLLLKGSVFCCQTGEEFARCRCAFEYDNREYGYIDVAQNIERSRALAVTLAFALCAADGKMYNSELEKIKDWARRYIELQSSKKAQGQLERALRKTIRFFKKGYKIDTVALAGQLAQIAPAAVRYDIIEMCLSVVGSKGFVSAGQIDMLKDLAGRLDIEPTRFRQMVERLAPPNTHRVKDMELIFGLGGQMTREQTRERLNNEYRKWNARITNMDPAIQTQAEQMLNLIAQARTQYIG
jgi:hypothetical protein